MKFEFEDRVITQGTFFDPLYGVIEDYWSLIGMLPQYEVKFYRNSNRTDFVRTEWIHQRRLRKDNPSDGH